MRVPCGRCVGCRLDRARDWSIRAQCEAPYHRASCFLTLTYDEEHLPPAAGLCRRHIELFLKRLRRCTGLRLKFIFCGEYGPRTLRPHYHVVCFGWAPPRRSLSLWRRAAPKSPETYISTCFSDIWPHGRVIVGMDASAGAAGYVARYSLKKQHLPYKVIHCFADGYKRLKRYMVKTTPFRVLPGGTVPRFGSFVRDSVVSSIEMRDGRLFLDQVVEAEFQGFSRGIGRRYLFDFHVDLLRDGFIRVGKFTSPLPKYFRYLLDKFYGLDYFGTKLVVQARLKARSPPTSSDLDSARLRLFGRIRESLSRPIF